MQHSEQPYLELDLARRAVDDIRQATSLEDIEEHWKEYLRRLERVWNKSANHFGKSPKWNGWQAKYLQLRKGDPLLCYFINARGADEHTVGQITERQNGSLVVREGPSGHANIRAMEVRNGKLIHISVGGDTIVDFHAAMVRLLPITNRKVVYDVPRKHLSHPIEPNNLPDIAELGIAFYADFLAHAEAFFIKPTPGQS